MNHQLPPPRPPEPAARPGSRSTGRRLLAVGVGAGLLAGGAIGFAAGVPALTSAATTTVVDEPVEQTDDTSTDDTSTDDTSTGDIESDAELGVGRATGERVRARLQSLVDDGTIDAAQADAVAAHLAAHLAEGWNERAERRHGPGHRAFPLLEAIDTAVEVLGVDAETLRDELRSGSSLAEIAEANDVDPQTLIDALVAEAEAMIDQAVADGRIDDDVAEQRRVDLEERVTDRVNGEHPAHAG